MRLGLYIREKRQDMGMSLADLSTKLSLYGYEVSKAAIGHWESGRNFPPIEDESFVKALSVALKIDTQTLWQHTVAEYSVEDLSPEARRAAEIVELMTDEKREMAINLLEAML